MDKDAFSSYFWHVFDKLDETKVILHMLISAESHGSRVDLVGSLVVICFSDGMCC